MEHEDWIDKLRQERSQEQQQQKHVAAVFPQLAKALWKRLCNGITVDALRLQQTFPEVLPDKLVIEKKEDSLWVSQVATYPYSHLWLTINIPGQTLTIKQLEIPKEEGPTLIVLETVLALVLVKQGQQETVQLSRTSKMSLSDEQILSPEEFSELCLRFFIDRQPVLS